ncbi:MAG: NAD-dependent epimerase/dehydratase family protein [Nodosilinea sp.]
MHVLVTGASGFLGQYVVANILRQGHSVRAVVRPNRDRATLSWTNHGAVEIVEADLTVATGLDAVVAGVDGVIHLAASKSGDFSEAYQGTVVTTKHLLDAMALAQVWRLVLVSSFSVYDYSQLPDGSVLDEACAVDAYPAQRDAYAQTKLLQEQAVVEFMTHPLAAVTVIRPGMIYGRGALWNACHGTGVGPLWLVIGPTGQMPLTYVENCADAIVAALAAEGAVGATINIVDDNLPDRRAYTNALVRHSDHPPKAFPVSWSLLRGVTQATWVVNQRVFRGRPKLPGLLIPARLDARLKPLTYSNTRAKKLLQWHPQYSWSEALNRCWDEDISLLST